MHPQAVQWAAFLMPKDMATQSRELTLVDAGKRVRMVYAGWHATGTPEGYVLEEEDAVSVDERRLLPHLRTRTRA